MQNKYGKLVKATIFCIIVAFLLVLIIVGISIKVGKEKFQMATDIVDMVTMDTNAETEQPPPVLQTFEDDLEETEEPVTVLTNTPAYGTQYATLKIPSIGIDLPIYYGKTLDLLKNGVGHDNDSYFPGEGGSIILMGHNYKRLLGKLPKASIGDQIQIITDYGEFNYTIYDTQIVNENQTNKVPIQEEKELLMIYTCWPINNVGYATERYVVYSQLVGDKK